MLYPLEGAVSSEGRCQNVSSRRLHETVGDQMNQHNLEPNMANYEQTIQQLYVAYFNRPADPGGLAHWQTVIEAQGGSLAIVTAAFASSDEYKKTFAGMNTPQIVNTV